MIREPGIGGAGLREPAALRASGSLFVRPRLSRGFTLIELLVVVVIVGVLAAALVIAIGGSAERQVANAAERFQALLGHACSEAELSGREIGVRLDVDGYAFKRLDGDAWNAFPQGDELRPRRWPAGLRADLAREGRLLDAATPATDAPQLVCFSSGELTPFSLTFALAEAPRYRLEGADDGGLKIERVAASP